MKHLLLSASLLLLCVFRLIGQTAGMVQGVGITVSDLDKSVRFYTEVLPFKKEKEFTIAGAEAKNLFGLPGKNARVKIVRLSLGNEHIDLMQFLQSGRQSRQIPPDSHSNDLWFQHIAIVVSDMAVAYQWLRDHQVTYVSTAPQTLPDYLPNAAGISAFYFRDPDGHNLEIIHFPKTKGNPKWQTEAENEQVITNLHTSSGGQQSLTDITPPAVFLGIDHTAIGIEGTDAGLAFYRDALGLTVGGNSENYGPEQEHLNQVFGAHLLITGLHARQGVGVEFLDYIAPPGGRPYPVASHPEDLWHWQTVIQVPDAPAVFSKLKKQGYRMITNKPLTIRSADLPLKNAFLTRDADGHAVLITEG